MIAVDTNILVRYFVEDHAVQTALAKTFIEESLTSDRPGLVTTVALIELIWVLQKVYRVPAAAIRDIIRKLLTASQIVVERAEAVALAITQPHGDFADRLIHEVGKSSGCSRTVTFDRAFSQLDGVELLA